MAHDKNCLAVIVSYSKCYNKGIVETLMDKLLSFEEAAVLTGIRVPTWRAWAAKRKIPIVRLGRRVKVRESDLQKLIESSLIPARPDRASR